MPDLLTHVLLVYAIVTMVSWHTEWIVRRDISVAMVGAIIPDLAKIELLVRSNTVEAALGLPFSWQPIHRLGGTLLIVAMLSLLFARRFRTRVLLVALFGALTQFPLDGLIRRANDLSPPYLYPLTWWRPPAGNVYLSSELWPVIPALLLAIVVWQYDRRESITID